MKKIVFFILLPLVFFSQVGIGTDNIHSSEVLKVDAHNQGVLLPRLNIPDLQKPEPVRSPVDYLFAYNTNINSGKGYYYWFNNKWNPLLDSNNVYRLLGIARLTIKRSNDVIVTSRETGAIPYDEDEMPNDRWNLIPGLDHTIEVSSSKNNIVVNVDGVAQRNSLDSN